MQTWRVMGVDSMISAKAAAAVEAVQHGGF
jgi:hypothetical protein